MWKIFYFFIFFAKLWQNRPRENRSIIPCDSFHKTTVFSHAWMLERLVRWESCGGDKCVVLPSEGECVSRREAKQPPPLHHQQRWRWRGLHPAQSLWLLTSVWWGSYRGQRSMEAAFMKERLCVCLTIFCTDGLSYDHWVRVCIPVSVGTVLRANLEFGEILISKCVSNIWSCRWSLKQLVMFLLIIMSKVLSHIRLQMRFILWHSGS